MPALMPKMFISYSRVDKDTSARLVQRLRRSYRPENVWFDEELHGGVKWWDEILRRISECDIFIYLLSNESVTSPYCQAEFTEARRLQKPIITVQIRNTTKLSDELKLIQYVDMRDGINDETLADLVRSVNEQAHLAKKRRALWTPATPMPEIPKTETIASTQPDVDTPTLESARPAGSRPAPRGDVLVARATVVAAVIGALALVITTMVPQFINQPPLTPSGLPSAMLGLTVSDTPIPTLDDQVSHLLTETVASPRSAGDQASTVIGTHLPRATFTLVVYRNRESVALCPTQTVDISQFTLRFGQNEPVIDLQDILGPHTIAREQCVCLQSSSSVREFPSSFTNCVAQAQLDIPAEIWVVRSIRIDNCPGDEAPADPSETGTYTAQLMCQVS